MIVTSSLDLNQLFLHFHEIGEGEGENNDYGSFVMNSFTCRSDPKTFAGKGKDLRKCLAYSAEDEGKEGFFAVAG
jgi:hypothetical protein